MSEKVFCSECSWFQEEIEYSGTRICKPLLEKNSVGPNWMVREDYRAYDCFLQNKNNDCRFFSTFESLREGERK